MDEFYQNIDLEDSSLMKGLYLQWFGAEIESVRESVSFIPPSSPTLFKEDIDSDYFFSLAGVNLRTTAFHLTEIEKKYTERFNTDDYMSDVSVPVNVYTSRHWASSCRFKYLESVSGGDRYLSMA